ncbi:hypothetical protein TNCV_3009521 [Trichonephila clavipes]|nr:hypothetical protein TNCV_3009521 [Trichonephila clavipes]
MAAINFQAQFPPQRKAPELRQCEPVLGFNLPRAPKTKRHSRGFFTCRIIIRHGRCRFLHHENPPTWAGVEPATLGAEGHRQSNHATQAAKLNQLET